MVENAIFLSHFGIWWRYKTVNKTIAILYICTGGYVSFWDEFFKSFESNFLNDYEKHYFVFTDDVENIQTDNARIHIIRIEHQPWPLITLLRFHYFLRIKEQLEQYEFLMFANSNLLCKQKITAQEFLPRIEENENFSFVFHAGFLNKQRVYNYPFERNRNSTAYIPYNCGASYVMGGMNVGRTPNYLGMCETLKERIEIDLSKNIIATWHDESHLNRFIVNRIDCRFLTPSYCYPDSFVVPYEKKICIVTKAKKFGVDDFKKINVNITFFRRVLRRLKSDGFIYYLRDLISNKKIEVIGR